MTRPEPETLLHVSPGSGLARESCLDDIDTDVLARLRPLIRQAINTGERVRLPSSRWTIAATEHAERLDAQAWYGPAEGEPHVRWIVLDRRRGERRLITTMHGLLKLQTIDAAAGAVEAGDFTRSVAWAWIGDRASD